LLALYKRLSDGGIGTIITSGTYVLEKGKGLHGQIGIHNDALLPGLTELAGAIHTGGALAIAQISYCGNQSIIGVDDETFTPSGVADPRSGKTGKTMTESDIKTLVRAFGDAASRASKAGFDGVQIHCAHGYLLSQFVSPFYNKRTDQYGGSPANRARIITEIIDLIKKEQPGLAVLIKINGSDYYDGGLTIEDSVEICRIIESHGIDAIELSGGITASALSREMGSNITTTDREAMYAANGAKVADTVSIPVISVGGYRSPDVMEKVLNGTKIEMISLSRPFFAEPELVNRWESGDRAKASCVSCNKCRGTTGNFCTVFKVAQ
ncbi:MAG TPA: NADH:flavin oxidoreductase, partial [Spirochaetota bacterium]|nr:NADH:flavin oxidoreductase [Spirochaetota bacterium]